MFLNANVYPVRYSHPYNPYLLNEYADAHFEIRVFTDKGSRLEQAVNSLELENSIYREVKYAQ